MGQKNITWPSRDLLPLKNLVLRDPSTAPTLSRDLSRGLELSSSGASPRPAFHLGGPSPVYVVVSAPSITSPLSQQALHESCCALRAFHMCQSFSPSASVGFLTVWEYLSRVLLKQLPIWRFPEFLLSQLVLSVGINWDLSKISFI